MSHHYYISDHHFGHENITAFESSRPQLSTRDAAEWLVAQHNTICTKRDKITFGGDVAVGKNSLEFLSEFVPKMKGQKELILGNHDDLPLAVYMMVFDSVKLLTSKTFQGERVWFTHIPIHSSELDYRTKYNVHGHLHSKVIDDNRYFNMCVEQSDGIPRRLDQILV